MKAARHHRSWPWVTALAVAGTSADAWAQARFQQIEEEPQWLRVNLREASAGAYAEGRYDTTSFKDRGTGATQDRIFVGPSLGLKLDGSVYHPSLLRYSLDNEGAFGWAQTRVSTGGASVRQNEMDYLGNFHGSGTFVQHLPVTASVFGGYDHDFRDYDFFNRVTVDSWRYGARVGWTAEPLALVANYTHRDEDLDALNATASSHEDSLTINGRQRREHGQTSLNYSFTQYDRLDYSTFASSGADHVVTLADGERFGSREQHHLDSDFNYARHDFSLEPSEELSASARLGLEHTPRFATAYNVVYDRYLTGGFVSDNFAVDASLSHQLYENFGTGFQVHASDFESSGPAGSGSLQRYGAVLSHYYYRNLSANARLSLNNAVQVDHVDQSNLNSVRNEAHSFASGGGGAAPNAFFLNLPDVLVSSVVVWRADRTQQFVPGIDYQITRNGALTQIERLTGSLMPDGVVVDYDTATTAGGGYELLADNFGIRMDLFHNLWGIYGRLSFSRNNATEGLRIADYASYTAGTDFSWRWFRAGAEYSIYDSTLATYRVARLFQSAQFRLDAASTLGFDFSESWTDYQSAHRSEQDDRVMVRFNRAVGRQMRLDVQGGYDWRRGEGVDQELAVFRAGLDYLIGRSTIRASYDFENDVFLGREFRTRHLFTLRLKRYF